MIESRAVEIRLETDPERQGPGRLVGTLMPYETRAVDRAEMFAQGALHWPAEGVLLREQHNRQAPIVRFTPTPKGRSCGGRHTAAGYTTRQGCCCERAQRHPAGPVC